MTYDAHVADVLTPILKTLRVGGVALTTDLTGATFTVRVTNPSRVVESWTVGFTGGPAGSLTFVTPNSSYWDEVGTWTWDVQYTLSGVTQTCDPITLNVGPSGAAPGAWTPSAPPISLVRVAAALATEGLLNLSDANLSPTRTVALLSVVDANVCGSATPPPASVSIRKTVGSHTAPPTYGPAVYIETEGRYDYAVRGGTNPATAWPWAEAPRAQNDDYPFGMGYALFGNGCLALGASRMANRERLHVAQTSYTEIPYELAVFTGYDRAAPAAPLGQHYGVIIDGNGTIITNGSIISNGAMSIPGSLVPAGAAYPTWGGYMIGAWADLSAGAQNSAYFSAVGGTLDHFQFVVQGEAAARMRIQSDGTLSWGDGTAAHDVSIARTAAGALLFTAASKPSAATPTVAELKAALVTLGLINA